MVIAPEDFLIATGGAITQDGDYQIHTFTANGTFTVTQLATDAANDVIQYLVCGGGGGAGSSWNTWDGRGGGGGAGGGLLTASGFSVSLQAYDVIIGAGGTGSDTSHNPATWGGNSSFSSSTPIYDYLGTNSSVGGLAAAAGWEEKQGIQLSASENGKVIHSINVNLGFIGSIAPNDAACWIEVTRGANPFSTPIAESEKVSINYISSGYNSTGTYFPVLTGSGDYSSTEDLIFPFTTPYTAVTNDYVAIRTDSTSNNFTSQTVYIGQLTATPERFYANNTETFWRGGSGSGAAIRMRINDGIQCIGGGYGGTVDPTPNQPTGALGGSGGGSPAINTKGEAVLVSSVMGYDGATGAGNGSGGGGGGGASAVGTDGTVSNAGLGGAGVSSSITGSAYTYSKGADGGDSIANADGSNGNEYGEGGEGASVTGTAGGSGGAVQGNGGSGYQGVVILRYKYQ